MRKPPDLDPVAAEFWKRHAKRLEAQGLLTDDTVDAFTLLCQTFSHLRHFKPDEVSNGWLRYFALGKQFQTYARGFGMGSDKVKTTATKTQATDEFGIPTLI